VNSQTHDRSNDVHEAHLSQARSASLLLPLLKVSVIVMTSVLAALASSKNHCLVQCRHQFPDQRKLLSVFIFSVRILRGGL
jgi:hypothetical protein